MRLSNERWMLICFTISSLSLALAAILDSAWAAWTNLAPGEGPLVASRSRAAVVAAGPATVDICTARAASLSPLKK